MTRREVLTAASYSRALGANERMSIALIGCGDRGARELQPVFERLNGPLTAFCDVWPTRAEKASSQTSGAKILADHWRLLEIPGLGGHQMKDPLAWFEVKHGAFVKHVVSPRSYGHGIGVGDINGDGRNDIVTPLGWLEAPADPRSGWKFHQEFDLVSVGYIYVLEVNGDGRNDLVTSMAHDYGLFWMENLGGGKWAKHVIDDTWSQAHAMTMVDLNGDGRPDFVTGKRYMAHNGSDPGEREPLGIYRYAYWTVKDGSVEWIKHIIDYGGRAGAGMQIGVADLDGDGDLDLARGGKTGLFLFENLTKSPRSAAGGSSNR